MNQVHIPILRKGKVYESLDRLPLNHVGSGMKVGEVSQANVGLIKRDFSGMGIHAKEPFQGKSSAELIEAIKRATDVFMNGTVCMNGVEQDSGAFVQSLSATTGLPERLCRLNMEKVCHVLEHIDEVLGGLTRKLPVELFDHFITEDEGSPVCFYAMADQLGVILPSNSPGVNSLWIPALAMKIPVVLKPGREDPWTPYRLIQSMVVSGVPVEAFSFYPTDHSGSEAVVQGSGKSIVFGGDATVKRYETNPDVEVHGSGRSKILVGKDAIDNWESYLDVMVTSMTANGGRSCVNASCIVVPSHGDEIADALAKVVAKIEVRALDDPEAALSGFASAEMAQGVNEIIEEGLEEEGVEDVTAKYRSGDRMVVRDGMHYLLPTVIRCSDLSKRLGNTEFMFPYVSVVEVPQEDMLDEIGFSLVVSAISEDEAWLEKVVAQRDVERLNIGAIPTCQVEWDQPHEGNLFEFLFRRRAIKRGV